MKSVSVRELKNNPSEALRMAREGIVVVTNRNEPQAVLVHLDDDALLGTPGVRIALAVALYRSESLPLARAAQLADMPLIDFIRHVSRLGIPVVRGDAQTLREDIGALDAWLLRER